MPGSGGLTKEALRLLNRLGFVLHGEQLIHKKMGVTLEVEKLTVITDLTELDDYAKSALRDS